MQAIDPAQPWRLTTCATRREALPVPGSDIGNATGQRQMRISRNSTECGNAPSVGPTPVEMLNASCRFADDCLKFR
jgi:hypothetical protein